MKVVCLGEIMLRLSTTAGKRLKDSACFDACYGGGEANVSVTLAQLGIDACFVSKVPNNDIGIGAIQALNKFNIDTSKIIQDENRLGIYYLETGNSLRASKVIYDRKDSSLSKAKVEDFDIDEILKGASLFHFSGITLALNENCQELVKAFIKKAKEKKILVSCDLNYRKKLWSTTKAQEIMKPLMKDVDICIGNEEDAKMCLGFKPNVNVESGNVKAEAYLDIFKQMKQEYHFKYIATSLRESFSASHNGLSGVLYDGENYYQSKKYDINPIVDRVGSGDAFSAGLIYAILTGKNLQDTIEYAVASYAIKHTIAGDFNIVSNEEIEELIKNGGNGRVVR